MRILITGASRGIGFDTAVHLAQQGHQVLALSRNEQKLKELQQQVEQLNPPFSLRYLAYDLANPQVSLLQRAIKELGGLDILVNNAGLLINKPFLELTDSDWRLLFEVNLFGVVALTKQSIPFLAESSNAHILNISSMGGFQGSSKFPGLSAYSSSKAALANLTECLAEELKTNQITVNCLALGAVQTEMLAEAFPGFQAPVSCRDMGEFVAYFCLHGQRFFNGKILPVSISTP